MQLAHTTCAYSKRIPSAARRSRFGDVSASLQPNEPSESALRSSAVMMRMFGFSVAKVNDVIARKIIDVLSGISCFIIVGAFMGETSQQPRPIPSPRRGGLG